MVLRLPIVDCEWLLSYEGTECTRDMWENEVEAFKRLGAPTSLDGYRSSHVFPWSTVEVVDSTAIEAIASSLVH